jgi:hypothetical protein
VNKGNFVSKTKDHAKSAPPGYSVESEFIFNLMPASMEYQFGLLSSDSGDDDLHFSDNS